MEGQKNWKTEKNLEYSGKWNNMSFSSLPVFGSIWGGKIILVKSSFMRGEIDFMYFCGQYNI